MASAGVQELAYGVQQYAWGKIGKASAVAQFAASSNPDFEVDAGSPYAELWVGTHPKCPSTVKTTGEELGAYLAQHPDALGSGAGASFGGDLPFLFKVLSVNSALSIQAHPNLELAQKLHAAQPDVYRDPNHKPEMAIALTPVTVLCGFRPQAEIVAFLRSLDSLQSLVGAGAADELEGNPAALASVFARLMKAPAADVAAAAAQLMQEASDATQDGHEDPMGWQTLVQTLHAKYPDDHGTFCVFFLNHLALAPGEAVFLGPNLPHAYLSGDMIECMATSDNVIRAGLTPKLRDVETLLGMLAYDMGGDHRNAPAPHDVDPATTVYRTPVPEFDVACTRLPASAGEATLASVDGPSVVLVTACPAGTQAEIGGVPVVRGTSLFVPAGVAPQVTLSASGAAPEEGEELVVFRGYCE